MSICYVEVNMANSPISDQIRSRYASFSPSERQVADYVCDHISQVSRMSIRDLKQAIGVSEPTVFRFCKALGYNGFKEFKISLAEQTPTFQEYFTASPSEGKSEVQNLVERMLLAGRDTVDATLRMLHYDQLEQAALRILSARRVLLFGLSTSYSVACDIQRRLTRIGLSAWAVNEFHEAAPQLTRFDQDDLLICVTQTGETREALETAQKAYELGVPVLAITVLPASPVCRFATLVLQTYAPELSDNRLGITTRMAQFAMADALYMAITHHMGAHVAELMTSSNVSRMRRRGKAPK